MEGVGFLKEELGSTTQQMCHFEYFSVCERIHLFFTHVMSSCSTASYYFAFHQIYKLTLQILFLHLLLWSLQPF